MDAPPRKSEDQMLVFGHTGITLGAAVLLTGALKNTSFFPAVGGQTSGSSLGQPQTVPERARAWLVSLGSRIDIRLLLVGSLLPDIIDKPVGQLFFRQTFSNGRIFSHSLLFLIVVTLAGSYLYRRSGRTWLLAFSFGTFTHLIFDQMWRTPKTLLWPLLGLNFERANVTGWLPMIIRALLTDPEVYVPELVGAMILLWFVYVLWRQGVITGFLKTGNFGDCPSASPMSARKG